MNLAPVPASNLAENRGDAVVVQDLHVVYDRFDQRVHAVDGVSLRVQAGQWLILAGPNGSGKSTLLLALSRKIQPSSGTIRVGGSDLASLKDETLAQEIFFIHQQPLRSAAPDLTLYENLLVADLSAANSHQSRTDLRSKYSAALEPLGLAGRLDQLAKTLSGGQRQLLVLAIARMRTPRIVLLDEALSALAPQLVELSLEHIAGLNRAGSTVIQVVHEIEMAAGLGHRTVGLKSGKIVYDASGTDRNVPTLRSWGW